MRKRHFGGKRKRNPMQWIGAIPTYGSQGTPIVLGAAPFVMELCGASGTAASFDPPIIQRFTVLRVLGELLFNQLAAPTALEINTLSVGIYVQQVGTSSNASLDPGLPLDAGESWLWIRHYSAAHLNVAGLLQNAPLQLPFGIFVDVKSKRVLREDQRLVLAVTLKNINASAMPTQTMDIIPYLRTLITKVA